jgi:hypothetical protein
LSVCFLAACTCASSTVSGCAVPNRSIRLCGTAKAPSLRLGAAWLRFDQIMCGLEWPFRSWKRLESTVWSTHSRLYL